METLRELRLESHLTQKALADMAEDITRHAVLRMEQHVYPTPLPSVIQSLSQITGYTAAELERQYRKEVHDNRVESGVEWSLDTLTHPIFFYDPGNRHPFREFRERVALRVNKPISAIQFCIAFSIHPYTLSEYENWKTTYPHPISLALTEAGLSSSVNAVLINEERFNRIE